MDDFLLFALVVALIFLALFVYFIPTYIANQKDHPQRGWIFVCNLFGGGTGIGWLVCLIWAMTYRPQDSPQADDKREAI